MNIIINAVLYHDKPRGVGNYFDTLLETLLSIDTTNQYFVFYGKWMTGYRFKTLSNPNLHLIELNIPRNKLFRKEVKQMKKLDKNKIYAFIGKITTRAIGILLAQIALYYALIYILDNCITVYR